MKKWISIILLCSLALASTGCSGREEPSDGKTAGLYFLNNLETKVVMQGYTFETDTQDGQIREVIEKLTVLPEKLEYKPPLSLGFSIVHYEVEDDRLQLKVDENYKMLKPTTEILVRAALVRSFTQIEGIGYVSITVGDEQLHDSLGNVVGLMSADQFIDNAGNEINSYEKTRLKLYFANEDGTALTATNRTVAYSTNIPMERLVMEQLLSGPNIKEAYPTINPEAKLVSIAVKDGICYVNLNDLFQTQVYNVSADVTIYSIVNSLTELTNINKVQISINGETNLSYRETYNLTTVFERNLDLVATPE